MGDVTRILKAVGEGEANAADELLSIVYDELRGLAAQQMANEPPGQTLQPTALVHEAWLRIGGNHNPQFDNRAHFFAAASEAMRRILIENARRKRAQRHGGGLQRVDLGQLEIAAEAKDDEMLAVHDALDALAAQDSQKAELVKLLYFVGLTLEEAAEILGISVATASRRWAYARAWLYRAIVRQQDQGRVG
jgi:RNA polymerase sigma factor (TIGR02999 family)